MRGDRLRGLGDELRKQQPDRFGASGERQGKGVRAILKSLGKALGSLSSLAFGSCTADGVTLSVTIKAKMSLNGVSFNKTKNTASMTITGIHGKLSISSPITCSAVINGTSATANNGTVTATFANKTNTLKVLTTGSNLHLYNDTCPVTMTGDAINFTTSYKFTPAQKITSP